MTILLLLTPLSRLVTASLVVLTLTLLLFRPILKLLKIFFDNVELVEKLTTANGTNTITIGTSIRCGILTVTGGSSIDTINVSSFDTAW